MKKYATLFLLAFFGIGCAFSQQQYETRLKEGIRLYEQNRFDDAIDRFKAASKAADIPADEVNTVYNWIDRCKKAQSDILQRFDVSPQSMSVSAFGGYVEITVKAGRKWQVSKIPDWCRIENQSNSHLRIFCQENDTTLSRTDSIAISTGKRQKTVLLVQEAAEPKTGRVVFRTNPNNARIDFWDGTPQNLSSQAYELKEGGYNIRISKDGYALIDTLIWITAQDAKRTRFIDIDLNPLFAELKLDIRPQEGSLFKVSPVLYIENRKVDLDPIFTNSITRSFDDQGNMEYFNLYKGNIVPLKPGNYTLTLKAEGFDDYTEHIEVFDGESKEFSATMQLISGFLSVVGNADADGAKIFVDDREVGSVPAHRLKIGVGKHSVRFEKDGYKSDLEEYETEIEENSETRMNITLRTYVQCMVNSTPDLAEIEVDGKSVGFTPKKIALTEGEHTVIIKKEGFLDYKEVVTVRPESGNYDINASLEASHPLKITSDYSYLDITIKRKKKTILTGIQTPAEVNLPYGKYTLILRRDNGRKAFKGPFRHTSKKKTLNVLSYARYNLAIIGGDYFLLPLHYKTEGEDVLSPYMYRRMADAFLCKVKILPGLSSTVLKASLFWAEKDIQGEELPETNDLKATPYPEFLVSGSCILLNGDLRLGGAIQRNIDINILGSYTWYPSFRKIISLSHVDGHDIFAGLEITSRFPVFNLNIKAGAQIFMGHYNIWRDRQSSSNTKERWSVFPSNYTGFVVSVGFTLGTKDSKGNNLLRLW